MSLHYLDESREPRDCDACNGDGTIGVLAHECQRCRSTGRLGVEGAEPDVEVLGTTAGFSWRLLPRGRMWHGSHLTELDAIEAARAFHQRKAARAAHREAK